MAVSPERKLKNIKSAIKHDMLVQAANWRFKDPYKPFCPFCGKVAQRGSQGEWPTLRCPSCKVSVEIRAIDAPGVE